MMPPWDGASCYELPMPRRKNAGFERTGLALVIGGGGAPGAASCCGALRALADIAGISADVAKVVIGTSAGAAIATDLRLGKNMDDLISALRSEEGAQRPSWMSHAWKTKPELLRRVVGSSWMIAQSRFAGMWPTVEPWTLLQHAFPGSLLSMPPGYWTARYPAEWPARELWLMTSDVDSGERVVLNGDHHHRALVPLSRAVQASCAVPGVYPPVRIGPRRLIDGGMRSTTNLDLAVHTGCRAVITLAPMGFDRRDPPDYLRAAGRLHLNANIDSEEAKVRRAGMIALTIRPGSGELRHHPLNFLSRHGHERILEAAYEETGRRLAQGPEQRLLDQIRAESLAPTR